MKIPKNRRIDVDYRTYLVVEVIISVLLKLFKLIIIVIMFAKKKTKFIVFKFLKDFAVITFTDFNKRKAFRTFNNFNINTKLILHDFKLITSDVFIVNIS